MTTDTTTYAPGIHKLIDLYVDYARKRNRARTYRDHQSAQDVAMYAYQYYMGACDTAATIWGCDAEILSDAVRDFAGNEVTPNPLYADDKGLEDRARADFIERGEFLL